MIKLNDMHNTRLEEGLIKYFSLGDDCEILVNVGDKIFYCLYSNLDIRNKDAERLDKVTYVNEMDEIISRREGDDKLCGVNECEPPKYLVWEELDFRDEGTKILVDFNGVNYFLVYYLIWGNEFAYLENPVTQEKIVEFDEKDCKDFFNNLHLTYAEVEFGD